MAHGYYDREAAVYDESRGGAERARKAAAAVTTLLPPGGRLLDVAGGTGIVSAELAAQGRDVVVVDLSIGMLRLAGERLPGRVAAARADVLPVARHGLQPAGEAAFSGRSQWGSAGDGDPVFPLVALVKG